MTMRLSLRSISSRLALWYALAATATLACLFVAGYFLLRGHLVHGLDMLNVSALNDTKAHLAHDYDPKDLGFIERRLRRPTNRTGAMFYIHVHNDENGADFFSTNLEGKSIPVSTGKKAFDVQLEGVGALHAQTFRIAPYTITIGTPSHEVGIILEGYAEVAFVLLGAMMVASLGIGFGLSRLALRPVRVISDTANRIRSDNLGERIPVGTTRDEISGLADMLNQMFDRLETSFSQIRRFAAEASHELKTPLSLVRLHAERMLSDQRLPAEHQESLQVQLEEIARLDQIIEELLFLSRADAQALPLELKHANPARFLNALAQDASVLAEHQGLRFAYAHDGEERVSFDEKRMRQVLLNLIANAINVSPAGGHLALRSYVGEGMWRMTLEDEGPGLPEEQLARVFDRFVRITLPGKEYKGSGLGLAICRSIIELHGGSIRACNVEHGSGLCIVIEIPCEAAARHANAISIAAAQERTSGAALPAR